MMLADPVAAAMTATFVALAYVLCNVYENEIAALLSPSPPPRLTRRREIVVQLAPFGDPPFGISPASLAEVSTPDFYTPSLTATADAEADTTPVSPLTSEVNSPDPTSGGAGTIPTPAPTLTPEATFPPVPTSDESNPSRTSFLPLLSPTSTEDLLTALVPDASAVSTDAPTPVVTDTSSVSTGSSTPESSPSDPLPTVNPDPTANLPHSAGIDEYRLFRGNGSIAAGWPQKADWMSYEDMFTANTPLIAASCTPWHVSPNAPAETAAIHNATLAIANETNTDPRFILAVILQESGGCVRVPTSYYSTRNPGLMQSHNGPATCNEDATPLSPCPYVAIEEMIREGTAGTSYDTGMGLVSALRQAEGAIDDVARYYRAARIYNNGSVDASGNLEAGIATNCYASDIANRLTGWVLADDWCDWDDVARATVKASQSTGTASGVPADPKANIDKESRAHKGKVSVGIMLGLLGARFVWWYFNPEDVGCCGSRWHEWAGWIGGAWNWLIRLYIRRRDMRGGGGEH